MRLLSRVLGAAMLFSVVALLVPFFAFAADLTLSPTTASHPVDEEFTVKVVVDPGGQNVNASDGTILFDKDILSVTGVSKDGSSFSLWTAEPKFSNAAGTVEYSGGTPSAFSKQGTIVTISFKGKKKGSAKVSVTKGSVLAADGKGTDVFKTGGEATYEIIDAPAAPAEDPGGGGVGPVPLAPNIASPTHPKEDLWYSTSTAMFTWPVLPEDVGVRTGISQSENDTPKNESKKIATSTKIANIQDGVWYFFAQIKNDSGWGAVGKRKIQVDSTPPNAFEVALIDGSPPKLSFKTDDALSGMDRYEIVLGSAVAATIPAAQLIDGAALVPPQNGGPQTVVIRAYDKANNKTEASKLLTLPKVDKPAAPGDAPVQTGFWTWERFLLILFALIIGAMGAWIFYARSKAQTDRSNLLHRISELGDKTDRIFSAMREQFEQMIKDLDEKPQLTPAEREFLEETKEVLDIAEEQISSGIYEIKRMARGNS